MLLPGPNETRHLRFYASLLGDERMVRVDGLLALSLYKN